MKSSFDRDNNYCHYVIQRIARFAMHYAILSSGRIIICLYIPPTYIDVLSGWLTGC
jgi:hypothetical protein